MGDAAFIEQTIEIARAVECDATIGGIDPAAPHHALQRSGQSELDLLAIDVTLLDLAAEGLDEVQDEVVHEVVGGARARGDEHRVHAL